MAKNKKKVQLKGEEIFNKKVLILGEVGSGKTKLAAKLLKELLALVGSEKITVIDLAPPKVDGIGGKLTDFLRMPKGIKYFSPKKVYTPRLGGKSPEQVSHYAELNRKNMEPLLKKFKHNITSILVVNDITLYLHAGKLETILECVRLARTFLATAYYGSKLADDMETGITARERKLTDELATFTDLVVKLDSFRKSVDVHAFSADKSD